jgi:predicted N-acetyltransferase YhbS
MLEGDAGDGTQIVVAQQPSGTSTVWLEREGKWVSRVVIIPMLMRIGAAVVRMDGIGGVDTEEEYRNRGYARRVMERAVGLIRAGDAALSTLFGIQDFYQKFGYETAGPEYTVVMPFDDASAATSSLPSGWIARPLRFEDLSAVMRLYHLNTRRATGALVRHDAYDDPTESTRLADCNPEARKIGLRAWNRLQKIASAPGEDACRVLLDDAGEIAAYAWFGANWWMGVRRRDFPGAFNIAEAMARDARAADALLAACRIWANEMGSEYEKVALAVPPEGPVASAAAYEGAEISSVYTRGGDFMARVLDVDRLLRQLLPELTARILATRSHFRGQLKIRTEDGNVSLFISPDGVSADGRSAGNHLTVELPQAMLARLCLGGFDTADVLARLPQRPDPEAALLLRALFPRRFPHIYPMDRF